MLAYACGMARARLLPAAQGVLGRIGQGDDERGARQVPPQATSVYTSVIVDPTTVHESDLWNAGLAQPASGVEKQIFGARRTAAAELP